MSFYVPKSSDVVISLDSKEAAKFDQEQLNSILIVLIKAYESGSVVNQRRSLIFCPKCQSTAIYLDTDGVEKQVSNCQIFIKNDDTNILVPSLLIHDLQHHAGMKNSELKRLLFISRN